MLNIVSDFEQENLKIRSDLNETQKVVKFLEQELSTLSSKHGLTK